MNLNRIVHLIRKELRQIRRDKRLLRMIFMASVMQLFVFGYGVSTDVNNVSTAIWNVIEKPMTVKDLCARLIAEYDVPPQRCESEVLQFVNTLCSKGLVKMVA